MTKVSGEIAAIGTPDTTAFFCICFLGDGQYDAANVAMLSILAAGNDEQAVKSMLPFIANHYIGTAVQTYLDANGDQAVAVYGVYTVNADKSAFEQIGRYDGATGQVTFE